jgi:predicted TIM-barrel fold metal-dependent hydrolase
LIIDSHIHVGSWLHADFLGRANNVAETLAMLDRSGVNGAVLMPSDRRNNAELLDELQAAVPGFDGPLWMLAWVGPGTDELAFVREHRRDLAGLKLHPSLSRVRVSDDSFRPALELAEELGLVVLVHCGRWTEIAGYAHAVEAAARHPRARFVFAHAGGDTPPNATGAAQAVADRGLSNVWFEFSGLREYWVIERNLAILGADRYMLGSDFPLAHPLMYLGSLAAMDLSDEDRARIAGGNAIDLFGPPLGS